MMKLLTAPWMTLVVAGLVYLGSTVAFWKTPALPKPADAIADDSVRPGPSWTFINPEADQLISELQTEKRALAKRDQDMKDEKAQLDSERSELKIVTQSVRQLQDDFDKNVLRITDEESANLKKLAKVYADMDPANAAKILQDMDDANIIKIMVFMKDPETAAIWEAMAKDPAQAKRAAALSDRLRLTAFRTPAK